MTCCRDEVDLAPFKVELCGECPCAVLLCGDPHLDRPGVLGDIEELDRHTFGEPRDSRRIDADHAAVGGRVCDEMALAQALGHGAQERARAPSPVRIDLRTGNGTGCRVGQPHPPGVALVLDDEYADPRVDDAARDQLGRAPRGADGGAQLVARCRHEHTRTGDHEDEENRQKRGNLRSQTRSREGTEPEDRQRQDDDARDERLGVGSSDREAECRPRDDSHRKESQRQP